MYTKLIEHIKNKLYENDEIIDDYDVPTDEQVKYIMLVTLEIVNNECQECFYCKNFKRFSLGSLCRIKSHTRKNCFHFTLDVNKVLKKKYYHILITINECTRGKHIITDKNLSQKAHKNIIYESIRLSETLKDLRELNFVSDSYEMIPKTE